MDSEIVDRDTIKSNGWGLGRCFDEHCAPEIYAQIPAELKANGNVYIAITHDCSLIHPKLNSEPYLEYLVAVHKDKINPQNSNAKNIRCLHLPLIIDGETKLFEIQIANRGFVDRALVEICSPSERILLLPDNKAMLVRWMSNRYTTQTLPDAFDKRIRPLIKSSKGPLSKLLKRDEATGMLGIYIDLEPPQEDLPDEKNYQLTVLLLYDASEEFETYYDLDNYAAQLKCCFAKASGVDVTDVIALSEKDISVYRFRRMRRWQLDYISFQDSTDDAVLIDDDLS